MKRWHSILLALLAIAAIFVLLVAVLGPVASDADVRVGVGVRGRLVDANSGEPISSAWVMSLPRRSWAENSEHVKSCEEWIRDYLASKEHESLWPHHAPSCGGGLTSEDGRFEFDVGVSWSYSTDAFGCRSRPVRPPPRHGIAVLRVEAPDRPVRIVELAGGDWQKMDFREYGDYWAKWDLGEVLVSFDE